MKNRNTVLDLIRGHFLIAVFVDHLSYYFPRNLFIVYNGNGNLFVSAAEGFVFISGFIIGLVYKDKLNKKGFKPVLKALFKRALKIYLIAIALTLFYTTIANFFGYTKVIGNGYLPIEINTIIKAFTFNYFYGWQDILFLYIPLILVSPFILLLLKKKLWFIVLIVSFALWFITFKRIYCSFYCISFFELISWQFIYIIGLVLGFYSDTLNTVFKPLIKNKYFNLLMYLIFSISLITSIYVYYFNYFHEFIDIINLIFNKPTLGFGRLLLFFNWFYVLYTFVNKYLNVITKKLGTLYLTLGKNSLLSYSLQSFILFFVYYLPKPASFLTSTIFTTVYLALLILLVHCISNLVNKLKVNF